MVRRLIATVRDVHVADAVKQYAIDLVTATREAPDLRLGASPRCDPAAAAHRPGGRRARGPRLRAARRPAGAGRAGARAPDHPDRRRAARPAHHRRDRRRDRAPAAAAARPQPLAVRHPPRPATAARSTSPGGADDAGGAARADHPRPLVPRRRRRRPALSAFILGEKDLLRVAVLLAVLPLLAAAYVGRSRYKLACTRSLEPHRVPVGASARVILRLQNLSRLPTGTLLLEDRLPYALGSRPRVVLERLGAHQASSVAYTVRADVRGRYQVGPLVDPADRPVRAVRADPLVPQRRPAHRDPAGGRRCRRSGWPASTPAPATAAPARWPCTARTTRRPGSTGAATTCAGCTGGRPRGPAS